MDTSNPYNGPTLNDMTTDVNFSLAAAEGQLVGLKTAYFGAQAALRTGTTVSLKEPPPDRQQNAVPDDEYFTWAGNFETDGNYKLMVQYKDNMGSSYTYPNENSERLASDRNSLTDAQKDKAAAIEKKLVGQAPAKN